jgi:hypothetical protein
LFYDETHCIFNVPNHAQLKMKKTASLLFAAICLTAFCSCNQSQNTKNKIAPKTKGPGKSQTTNAGDEAIFTSLDNRVILKTLFDNPVIDRTGTAMWKPNYYERMSYPVSYDGNCHTNVDTTMYFDDTQHRHCAAVILTTYKSVRSYSDNTKIDTGDCHFCGVPLGIALFAKNDSGKWELYKFEKEFTSLGYFGNYRTGRRDAGKISLKKIGDSWTCLSLVQGVGGNGGESSGNESLYSIEQYLIGGFPEDVLSPIFDYTFYYEMDDNHDQVKEKQTIKMNFVKKKKGYYDIDLVINKNGKVTKEGFKFSDEGGRYVER